MKPRNFPARKIIRQLNAQGQDIDSPLSQQLIETARAKRTKKNRGKT